MSDLQPDSVISGIHAIMQIYKLANVKTDLNPDEANDRIDQAYKHKQAGFRRNKGNLQFLLGNIFDHDHLFGQMTNCQ